MKEFVKIILAVICAFVIMGILRFLFFLLILGSAAMSGSGPAVPKMSGSSTQTFSKPKVPPAATTWSAR